jgi:hypothetical protein
MAPQWKHLIGGSLFVAATICILPIASGSGAPPSAAPNHSVNRGGKSDRLIVAASRVAKRKSPVQTIEQPPKPATPARHRLLDGCEPLFSPVAVPQMAHLAGRCIG